MQESETYRIPLCHADGNPLGESASLVCLEPTDETESDVGLRAALRGRTIEAFAPDYFAALAQLRQSLEPERLFLRCFGSCVDVYPSGMSRSMGYGVKAYRLTFGRPGALADLVSIFDDGEPMRIGTVAQQRAYFEGWLASLGA